MRDARLATHATSLREGQARMSSYLKVLAVLALLVAFAVVLIHPITSQKSESSPKNKEIVLAKTPERIPTPTPLPPTPIPKPTPLPVVRYIAPTPLPVRYVVPTPVRVVQPVHTVPQPTYTGSIPALIRSVFGGYAASALRVASCESGFNPNAYNGIEGATGVFQFLYGTWLGTPYRNYSRTNGWANVEAAWYVFARDGHTWREWQCQP